MKRKNSSALAILDEAGKLLYEENADKEWESSSTIKIPLLVLALITMAQRQDDPARELDRLPHHSSQGSGILNWTVVTKFKLGDLISTTLIYSDCLATNILLDYIGGQEALNSWLSQNNLSTRLVMPYLHFSGGEPALPRVGITTAREMASLFKLLDTMDIDSQTRQIIKVSSGSVHESWLELGLPAALPGLRHKTGSMINCGPEGETVYNAAGTYMNGNRKFYFCILSHGWLAAGAKHQPPEFMRRQTAMHLYSALTKMTGN